MDNYDLWERRERKREKQLATRPICVDCEHPIQDEHCYEANGEYICPTCMEEFHRKNTEDCM